MRFGWAIGIASCVVACGSAPAGSDGSASSPSTRGAAGDDAGGAVDAAPPLPEAPGAPVARSEGGDVLRAPRVVAITFDADPQQRAVESLVATIAQGAYWSSVAAEYGVGALTVAPPIHVAAAPPGAIDDGAIARWLRATIGPPDPDAIYAVFYPAGTRVTFGGFASCEDFGGYHGEAEVSGASFAYAVVPRCASFAGLAGDAFLGVVASHEILESATNPHPVTHAAWDDVDDAHAIWSLLTGGELGDLCGVQSIAIGGATLQRAWSNAAARAGHDPCVPSPAGPYFTAAAIADDDVALFGRTTKGVKIALGDTRTIDVVLSCDGAPCDPWSVDAIDLSEAGGGPREIELSLDRSSGASGDVLHLTLRPLATDPMLGGEAFALVSRRDGRESAWYGFVAE